ncbi:MAG: hypothetical protein Fur0022_43710 [Anaerolineales bacterium]
MTYFLEENESFQGTYYLLNQQPAESYALICLLDYKQTPCLFDGKDASPYFLEMGENEERTFSFETPAIEKGFHDLAILAFSKVDEHDTSESFRYSTDFNYLFSTRAAILADTPPDELPLIEYEKGVFIEESPSPLNGVVINLSPDSYSEGIRAWLHEVIQPGQTLDYYIQLGNDDEPDQTYAVLSFLDFQQIPVNENQLVAYVSLPTGYRMTIPASLTVPEETGIHELVIVIVRNPYRIREDLSTRKLILPDGIESSIRVAIEVK